MIQVGLYDVEGVITPAGGSSCPLDEDALTRVRTVLEVTPIIHGLCTGRSQGYVELLVQALNLMRPLSEPIRSRLRKNSGHLFEGWPLIVENGALYYDPVSQLSVAHPYATLPNQGVIQFLRWNVLSELAPTLGTFFERGKEYSISLNPPPGMDIRTLFEAVVSFLEAKDKLQYVEIAHSQSAVDITMLGVSKASAVAQLMAWAELSPEEILGVGDSMGDRQWLQLVRWSAAPANGRRNLSGLSYYSSFEEWRGLIDILEHARGHQLNGLTPNLA